MWTRWISAVVTIGLTAAAWSAAALEFYPSVEEEGYAYLIANGTIMRGALNSSENTDAQILANHLRDNTRMNRPTALFLTIYGGVGEWTGAVADSIINASNELHSRSGLYNIVVVNEQCDSACGILLAHLTSRRNPLSLKIIAAANAKFGFHRPSDVIINKRGQPEVREIQDPITLEKKIRVQLDLLSAAGVDANWLAANESLFRTGSKGKLNELTAQQLCDQKSKIIPNDSCVPANQDTVELASSQLKSAVVLAMKGRTGRTQLANAPAKKPVKPVEQAVLTKMDTKVAEAKKPVKPAKDEKLQNQKQKQ